MPPTCHFPTKNRCARQPGNSFRSYMERFEFDGWLIEFDSERTRAAYRLTEHGAHDCTCACCRNYVAARDSQYPPRFLYLLNKFGIAVHKEAELWESSTTQKGIHFYAGRYHFVGSILKDPGTEIKIPKSERDAAHWYVSFRVRSHLAMQSLQDLPLIQLEFHAEVPWALDEPPR
jgi:hypothetical protein